MKSQYAILALGLFIILSLGAFAADAPKPDPALQELAIFVGTFDCKGMAFASDFGPEHATRALVTGKWQLDKKWVEYRYIEIRTKVNPMPFAIGGFMGHDPATKLFLNGGVDNMGGYGTSNSPGWEGDKIVFTGNSNMGGKTFKARDTFTKKSATQFTHEGEMETGGTWKKTDEETCTKK